MAIALRAAHRQHFCRCAANNGLIKITNRLAFRAEALFRPTGTVGLQFRTTIYTRDRWEVTPENAGQPEVWHSKLIFACGAKLPCWGESELFERAAMENRLQPRPLPTGKSFAIGL